MAAQITTLRKLLVADVAKERPRRRVLAKVVAQVAALTEDGIAASKFALEVKFSTLGFPVINFNRLVPLHWDALKFFLCGGPTKWAHLGHALSAIFVAAF